MKTGLLVDQIVTLNTLSVTPHETLQTVVDVLLSLHGQHAHRESYGPPGHRSAGRKLEEADRRLGGEPGAARIEIRSGGTSLVGSFSEAEGPP
jgi:hypothetical protein